MKSRFWFPMIGALGMVISPNSASFAQMNTGTVTGVVQDTNHASVPGAQVQVINEGTGHVTTAVSSDNGAFSITFLAPGIYDVSSEAKGFARFEQKALTLVAGQILRVDIELKVGSVTETMTVTADAPLLQLSSSDQLHTVTDIEIHQLPETHLDWSGLLNSVSGLQEVTSGGTGTTVLMNGLAAHSMKFTIDGTDASGDARSSSLGFYQGPNVINALNTDAIAEVSVVKGIAPASIGGTMSGNVNLISKGGTNDFHGDVYEVNSLSDYSARNQFLTTRPRSTFNQYGGSLGGRIIKDKLFFFGSYEGVQSSSLSALSGNVPTPYLQSISPSVYSSIFAAFPSVAQPAGSPTALTALYNGVGSARQTDNNTSERIDYVINSANELSVRYTRDVPFDNIPRLVAIDSRSYVSASNMTNISFTHTMGNLTSSTRFGNNQNSELRIDNGFNSGLEGISFSGFNTGGAESNDLLGATTTYLEDISVSHGRNLFAFGGIVQRQNWGHVDLNTANLSYSSLSDFQNNIPSSVALTFDVPLSYIHEYQYGGYFQDDLKATRSLTLNLGVRYDYFSVPRERDGRIFNRGIDPNQPQLGYGFGPYLPPSRIYGADYNNVQPRAGFAWMLGSSQKTVVRGGFGVFVSPHPMQAGPVTEVQAGPTVPFRATINRSQALAATLQYPIPRTNFIPVLDALQSSGVLSTNVASSTVIAENDPNAYSMQWMAEVEHAIGFGTTISVGYIGNRGLKLNLAPTENLPNRTSGIAPDATFGQFTLDAPWDASRYNALQVSLDKRLSNGLNFSLNYTHASNNAFCGGDIINTCVPQDSSDFTADYGPTDFEVRDAFKGSFVYELPLARLAAEWGRAGGLLIGGWQLSGILTANNGNPVNITNGNSSYPSDRPDPAIGVPAILGDYQSTRQYLNHAAFATIPIIVASGAQSRDGKLKRDAYFGPGMWNLDSSLAKSFDITERIRFQLHGDFFNTFNHTNLSGLVTNISSGSFGQLTSATARTVQIGGKISF